MKRSIVLLVAIAVISGCGDSPSGPGALNIGGTWTFTESFSNVFLGISCQNEGTYTLIQTRSNFSGTYSQDSFCTSRDLGVIVDGPDAGSVAGGSIVGQNASFQAGDCSYAGVVSGSPPNRISGSLSCIIALAGVNYDMSGTWTATR